MNEPEKPKCHGHMPPFENRAIACGTCRLFDGCAVESQLEINRVNEGLARMRMVFAGNGISMEKVESPK
jgi:hypothetical protein